MTRTWVRHCDSLDGMKTSRTLTFRIAASSLAAATALGLAAPAASAQVMVPTSSEGRVSMVPFYLPDNVVDAAKKLGIPLPEYLVKPEALKELGNALGARTKAHLAQSGHTSDQRAINIAREWAAQAARGEVKYYDNVGRGKTHLDKGDGNIYRLTQQQVRDRLKWLDRDANRFPDGKRFGTAVSNDGKYVYLVEYFLN